MRWIRQIEVGRKEGRKDYWVRLSYPPGSSGMETLLGVSSVSTHLSSSIPILRTFSTEQVLVPSIHMCLGPVCSDSIGTLSSSC